MTRTADAIKEDSICLWEALRRFQRGTYTDEDCATIRECYERLRHNVTDYYERYDFSLAQHEIWFASAVLAAFEDLYSRKIVKTY